MTNTTTNNSTSPASSSWTGMVPVDDTALAVTDTGAPGIPVVYLNGQFATQGYWRRVIAELGTGWRHITYDERARGTSKRSADYSFEAAVGDVDAVLAARGVDRALLVGWSYGAVVAAHWASRNPDRTLGAVLVDGAYPYDWLDEAASVRLTAIDGDVEVGRLNGPAEISTARGDIRIAEAVRGTVVLHTQSGDISVVATGGVSAALDAGTGYGRISNALKNDGAADLDIRATTSHGDITARSL